MGTKSDQQQRYFEMFCRDYPLPEGKIVHTDKPDVILDGRRKIGIEITNFYFEKGAHLESEQMQRNLRTDVVEEAQRMYLNKGGKRIKFAFSFDNRFPIRDKKKLATQIVEFALKNHELKPYRIQKDFFTDIPEISYIHLYAKEYADPKWQVNQLYQGQPMSRDKLLSIVKGKERKVKGYQRCDAYWLVVVIDFMDRAQDQEIPVNGFEKVSSTVFERVLVYKTVFGQVLDAS